MPEVKQSVEGFDCACVCRDLKLENIFLSKEGEVMLGDFGLTMSTKQELAVSPVGTVEYMAPEVDLLLAMLHAVNTLPRTLPTRSLSDSLSHSRFCQHHTTH